MTNLFKLNISLIALCLFLTSCSEPPEYNVLTPVVDFYQIPERNLHDLKNFSATVKASDLTELSFRVSGELMNIPVKIGQIVQKGDLIAEIDPTDYALVVKDKEAKVKNAKKSRDRAQQLVKLGSMSKSTFDELDAQYRVAQSQYDLAKLNLKYVKLTAPFDGVIADIPAENFQSTKTGQLVATIHRGDKIELQVELPDVILAATNQTYENRHNIVLDAKLDAYPNHIFKAKYKKHTTEFNQEDRSFILTLELPVDKERPSYEGMPGSVEFDLSKLNLKKHDFYTIPVEALIKSDYLVEGKQQYIVWVLNEDLTVRPVNIKPNGFSSLSMINVSGELEEGDKVITKGLAYLRDGLSVKIRSTGVSE